MKQFILLLVAGGFALATQAQTQKVIADKIVGQVGDMIILRSDIMNAIEDYKRQGQEAQLPANPQCAFLEGQLIQKALVLQAAKDSILVSDDELEALLDNRIRYFISTYGSKDVLEEIAGKSVYQIKEDFRQPIKEQKLAEEMRSKIVDNVKITPTEVKEYFDKLPKDSLPFYESQLEVSQIVMYPKTSRDVDDYVIKQLNDLKQQVESGGKKFDALARLYSEEPAAKETGGQMSINRNDKNIDPTFLAAAFRLKEGQISQVIKSKFGYHIIQMVSRAGDDAVVRHIIRIPPVSDADLANAKAVLDSIRGNIVNGTTNFGQAVNKYSEDDNSKFNGGALTNPQDGSTYVNIDQLDKDLVVALKNMKVGDITQALNYTDERGRKAVRILYLKTRTEPHRENLKDDYNRVAQRVLEQKKQQVLERWFREHIPTYYINIDKEFAGCSNISEWISAATANATK